MSRFFTIAHNHDAELFLSGRDHHDSGTPRMNASGEIRRRQGVVQYISGAGRQSHYQADGNVIGSLTVINDAFGVLRLALRADGYEASFRRIDAQASDVVGRSCH